MHSQSKRSLPFAQNKPLIGMIHLRALPGTPAHTQPVVEIVQIALEEAHIYLDHGIDGLLLENMHDAPYLKGAVGPEIVASMTAVAAAVRAQAPQIPIGIQILAAANWEAMAVALAAELDFVRVEAFVFGHVADEGLIEACAGDLLRYRKAIGADSIRIWADVKKKHSSHAITADITLAETVHAVDLFRGDAAIVTGNFTGDEPKLADLQEAQAASSLPVLLGSGIRADNLEHYWTAADGFIVGSYFKQHGHWANPIDPGRVQKLVAKAHSLR